MCNSVLKFINSAFQKKRRGNLKSVDPGILPQSICFAFTPPEVARELFFYPTWCGHYYCTVNYFMKRESYPPLLVVFVRKGQFLVEYRGEHHAAEQGDVVLLDCTEPHYYYAEDGLEFVYMHFDGSNAHAICQHIINEQGCIIRKGNNVLVGNLLYDMVQLYQKNGLESTMERSMRIYRLFELLLAPHEPEQQKESPVEQAILYIRAHLNETISVEDLANEVHLSVSYFSHQFKRHTGFSPLDFVINSRLEQAKVLLVRTEKPIAEIAYEVGYGSSGSFINLFVKKLGVSPRQYRKQHQSLPQE